MTIEETAKEFATKKVGGDYSCVECTKSSASVTWWEIYSNYIEIANKQQKVDIEDRFGSINHIQNVLQTIINNAETMTSGNVGHHRASIKLLAEGLLNYTKAKDE